MSEYLIVTGIVALAAGHVVYRYVPRTWFGKANAKSDGCGSGCGKCGGCGSGGVDAPVKVHRAPKDFSQS